MKKILLVIFVFLSFQALSAKDYNIHGSVLDSINNKPLPGVSIALTNQSNKQKHGEISNNKGEFLIENLSNGIYELKISYIGFANYEKILEIKDKYINLGKIYLIEKPAELGEVEVLGKMPAVEMKGDTTQFNADAYKVNKDAVAEDLVQKMPGVVVQNNQVQAQGENVKKVLMDGKPFFGEDPTAALKNLPAEVIDKVQIYDQKSEQSQFTGFDDGETTKTMNIITRPNMRTGQFGKAYAGYGTQDKYQAGTNFNIFGENRRISILGQVNNINQQNFAIEDILGAVSGGSGRRPAFFGMGGGRPPGGGVPPREFGGGGFFSGGGNVGDFLVGQQNGVSSTNAFGVNYTDSWTNSMKVTGSYFINSSNNDAIENTFRDYVSVSDTGRTYNQKSNSVSDNINHRFNFRFDWDIDSSNSILIRPRVTVQQNNGTSITTAETYLIEQQLNSSYNDYNKDLNGYNLSNELLFKHKFETKGRTISLSANTGYNNNLGKNLLDANSRFYMNNLRDTLNQQAKLISNGLSLSYNAAFTEPLWENSQLQVNYNGSYNENESDKKTYDYTNATKLYDNMDTTLSNIFSNNYYTQSLGTNYMYQLDEFNINAGLSYQFSKLHNDRQFPYDATTERSFKNLLPSARFQYKFSKMQNIRLFYRTSTDIPTVSQLQDVINNTNPLQLSSGNSHLSESYQHNLNANYMSVDIANATNFFFNIGGRIASNYIGQKTQIFTSDSTLPGGYVINKGTQLTTPVNLDNYFNLRSFVNYGFPVNFLSCNLNLNAGFTYSKIPGQLNNDLNYSHNKTVTAGVVLVSNISPAVDFSISSFSNINFVENTIRTDLNSQYLSQNTRLRFNFTLWEFIILRSDINHQYYSGLSASYNQNYLLWNAGLAFKFFGNKQGELSLSAFDLLKQNKSITRNINDIYIEDNQTNVLGQYLMLSFTYTFRNFGAAPPPENKPPSDPPFKF